MKKRKLQRTSSMNDEERFKEYFKNLNERMRAADSRPSVLEKLKKLKQIQDEGKI